MTITTLSPLVRDLRSHLGMDNVLWAESDLVVYECDGYTIEKNRPDAVVFPRSAKEVADCVKVCNRHRVPLVARGAGTSLAGGCLPLGGGVVMMLTRMKRIVQIDLRNRFAVVEAGVPNIQLNRALTGSGFHYAPDPSSQGASTIGGNVATNAGGPHTLKYGVTVNHVLGVEVVLGDGSLVELGPVEHPAELDLTGVLVGSEGTLGIITKVWVRLTPNPQDYRAMRAIFDTVDDATNAISDIIGAGMIPAAMELMDQGIVAAVEEAYHFGFPLDAGAIVVIELDGPAAGIDEQQRRIVEFCQKWHAREVLQAATAKERELLWKCRKMSVGAVGRLSPSYCIQDGVVPRTRLPHILRRITEISAKHRVRIVNVAHAGDGNVHPIVLFDERDKEEVARVLAAGNELLEECVSCGGSVTAEHGVGVEKLAFMTRLFTPTDLESMARVHRAMNPTGRLCPGKLLPPLPLPSGEGRGEGNCETALRGKPNPGDGGVHDSSPSPRPSPEGRGSPNGSRLPLTETIAVADAHAVVELVRQASQTATPVYPIGGGTLACGVHPKTPGIGLSLTNLNRLIDYPARDLTITVEAGMTIAALAKHLAAEGQRLPIDVPQPERATIGGVVAANVSGPRRYRWGTARDYVLGFHAVDGTGMPFCGGGRVVKNAAGYNMSRLMAGSFGTLGVITQVTLMVKPMPETTALVACDVADLDMTERLLADLVKTKTLPSAIEWMAGPAFRAAQGSEQVGLGRLVVGFEGTREEVDWMIGELQERWQQLATPTPTVFADEQASQLWTLLAEFPSASPTDGRAPVIAELDVLPGAIVETVRRVRQLDPQASFLSHAGSGVLRVEFALKPEEAVAAFCRQLRPAVVGGGGAAIVWSYPPDLALTPEEVWGPKGEGHSVRESIKRQFDPQGILNPGRFGYGY
jgi:glycolate oxidase